VTETKAASGTQNLASPPGMKEKPANPD